MPPKKPRRLPAVSWDFESYGQRRPTKRRTPIVDPLGMTTVALDKAYRPFYDRIFDALEPEFASLGFAPRVKDRFHNEIAFATEYDRINYRVGFWTSQRNEIHAYVWLARKHAWEFNRALYTALAQQRAEISRELTAPFGDARALWRIPTNAKDGYGTVGIGTAGLPDGSGRPTSDMKSWMLKSLPHVERVLAPRLAEIWQSL